MHVHYIGDLECGIDATRASAIKNSAVLRFISIIHHDRKKISEDSVKKAIDLQGRSAAW